MQMEEESDSISARTRSQNPIVTLQEANNIYNVPFMRRRRLIYGLNLSSFSRILSERLVLLTK